MAETPGFFEQINYIKKFVSNPCDAPWIVYIELFFPALGIALLHILTFGMDDILRGWIRPKGVKGPWHRRKGRKGKARFRGIPEIGEAIGSRLPGAEQARGRKVSQGVKHMWAVDGVLQRILWYWLLVDVVVEGFYQWTSMINKTEFCKASFGNALSAHGGGGAVLAIQGWEGIVFANIDYLRGACTWNVATGSVPAGRYQVGVGLKFTNTGPNPQDVLIGIFPSSIPLMPDDVSDKVHLLPLQQGEAVAAAEIVGPRQFVIQWKTSSGFTAGDDGFVFAIQIAD